MNTKFLLIVATVALMLVAGCAVNVKDYPPQPVDGTAKDANMDVSRVNINGATGLVILPACNYRTVCIARDLAAEGGIYCFSDLDVSASLMVGDVTPSIVNIVCGDE